MSWSFALAGAMTLLALALIFQLIRCWLVDPEAAKRLSSHDPTQFAEVMAGRYAFMAVMLVGGFLLGGLAMLAFVFAALGAVGFYDGWVYHRVGKPTGKHLQAGAAGIAASIACLALWIAVA
ncbi:MAG: hypothetical protein MK180_00525 [Rhodobacteraceae bacterium]|nr:hypothetical protein [Paracoccaceae bacterium]